MKVETSAARRNLARLAQAGLAGAVVLECIAFALYSPTFLTAANAINVALQVSVTAILAIGMTLVILTGGIDLSVGSLVAVAGALAAFTARFSAGNAPLLAAIIVGLAAGAASGSFTGFFVTRFSIPPFIVTLALMSALRGAAFLLTGGYSVADLPLSFARLGRGSFLYLPVPVIAMALLYAAGAVVLSSTVFGRHIYAVGGNERAAWLAGVRTARVKFAAYLLNGMLGGFAGVMLASRLGAGIPNAGLGYELDVIAAVVVGGASLFGGKGTLGGTLLGAIFIGILNNGLNLANVDPYLQKIALGAVILGAVLLDRKLSKA
jgi:ribose/xylose/arabinose/galactoside ABC-type transport system permease subunit